MTNIIETLKMIFILVFIICSLVLNFSRGIMFLILSIILALIFRYNSKNLIKIDNRQIYIYLIVTEFLILIDAFNLNSSIVWINNLSFMLANLIMFFKSKKYGNHCTALFNLLINLLVYIIIFRNYNNNLLLCYCFLIPTICYLYTKIDMTSLFRKKNKLIYLIQLLMLLSLPVGLIVINSKNLIIFNLENSLLLLTVLSYYFFANYISKKIVLFGFINNFKLINYLPPKKENIKRVSAVIPNYNYANYIKERIDSIISQTYPIYELIILDDCSKDNSVEIIENEIQRLKDKYPDLIVKFIKNEKNSGNVFKQWKKAFEVYTGDYLWICEADDLCSKYFLNAVMKGFNDEKVILSYSESKAIDSKGKTFKKDLRDWIDIYNTGHWNNDYIMDGKNELKYFMCINNTIANVSGVVFKRVKKCEYGSYLDEAKNFILAGDWYFYSKVLLNGKISYVSNSFNYHRIHDGSVTSTTDNFVHYKEILKIQESIDNDVKIPAKMTKRVEERDNNLRKQLCISDDEIYYDKLSLSKLLKKKNINNEIILSIIIPVYNVEKYLRKCLKSLFSDLPIKTEVIIINDGSPDNSEEIINEFLEKHNEIIYIKKKNGGLSSVKNLGLKKARGKYVIFLDSDDYVSSNMYSTMLKKIIDLDADIVYSDVLMTYEDGTVKYISMKNYDRKDDLMQILDCGLMAASWNKVVKKELYDGLEFPEGLNNEDIAVSPQLFLRAKKIEHIASPFYKYVQRSGSIQNSGFNEKRFVIFKTAKLCFDYISDYDYISQEKVIASIITHQLLAILIYLILPIKNRDEKLKYIKLFCNEFNELHLDISNNQYVYEYLVSINYLNILSYIYNNDYESLMKLKGVK